MDKIQVQILNPDSVIKARDMLAFAARLTQNGHKIHSMMDLKELYEKSYKNETIINLVNLPHPTLQKFNVINVAIVGASRRFLAQITRHQNEVKFMSTSLQYSNYSEDADFFVPYEFLNDQGPREKYLQTCRDVMHEYADMVKKYGNDTAGYIVPQCMRIALIISATPYQWKHMIGQRICKRNTAETRYIMLRIWQALANIDDDLFSAKTTGCFCMRDKCEEGKMSCGAPIDELWPDGILATEFGRI